MAKGLKLTPKTIKGTEASDIFKCPKPLDHNNLGMHIYRLTPTMGENGKQTGSTLEAWLNVDFSNVIVTQSKLEELAIENAREYVPELKAHEYHTAPESIKLLMQRILGVSKSLTPTVIEDTLPLESDTKITITSNNRKALDYAITFGGTPTTNDQAIFHKLNVEIDSLANQFDFVSVSRMLDSLGFLRLGEVLPNGKGTKLINERDKVAKLVEVIQAERGRLRKVQTERDSTNKSKQAATAGSTNK